MFRGLSAVSIDAKNRVTIPSHYRKAIMEEADGELVLTINTEERCLWLYPAPIWQGIEEKLEQLPSFHPATRRLQRLLIGHATDIEVDRQGRILLPTILREYAGLGKDVVLVGLGNKIEVWGEAQWYLGRDAWLAEDMNENSSVPSELLTLPL